MKKLFMVAMIGVFGVVLAENAMAIPIVGGLSVDFRTSAWAGADNDPFWIVGNVTATALPVDKLLHQDSVDGLGVKGGTQDDEIDNAENLKVDFSGGGMNLTGVWITDLFQSPDGNDSNGEHGSVTIGLNTFHFYGNASDQANGEQYVDFGGQLLVTSTLFKVEGGTEGNEFSVAGFTATAVPEPTTLLLLGFGLVGLAGITRMYKK